MVLVDFLVNGSLHLLVLSPLDALVGDGWGNLLVDGGVVVTRVGHEVLDCCLGGIHRDWK